MRRDSERQLSDVVIAESQMCVLDLLQGERSRDVGLEVARVDDRVQALGGGTASVSVVVRDCRYRRCRGHGCTPLGQAIRPERLIARSERSVVSPPTVTSAARFAYDRAAVAC